MYVDKRHETGRSAPSDVAIAAASLAILLFVLAVVLTVTLRAPLKDDVAWLLYVARAVLDGHRLYADIVEINPPLIVWLSTIPVGLAAIAGLPVVSVAVGMFAAAILGCAWWSASLLRGYSFLFQHRMPVFAAIAIVLLLVPGVEFGQREHLLIAFMLPYLCLYARRLTSLPVRTHEAVLGGLLAGLGCGLKPSYLLAVAVLESAGWFRGQRPLRAETVAAAMLMLAYAIAVARLFPDYFDAMVPLTLALYGASDASLGRLILESQTLLFGEIVAAALLAARIGALRRDALFFALVMFGIGATAACFIQGKDWFYHRLPSAISVLLSLIYWMAAHVTEQERATRGLRLALVAAACAIGGFGGAALDRLKPQLEFALEPKATMEARIEHQIERTHAKSYMAFSQSLSPAFPVVNDTGVAWTSRFDSMWALRGALWQHRFGARSRYPVEKWIVADFLARCPDLVVVDDRDRLDYLRVLRRMPAFAAAWARYRFVADLGGVRAFKRDLDMNAISLRSTMRGRHDKTSAVALRGTTPHACDTRPAGLTR